KLIQRYNDFHVQHLLHKITVQLSCITPICFFSAQKTTVTLCTKYFPQGLMRSVSVFSVAFLLRKQEMSDSRTCKTKSKLRFRRQPPIFRNTNRLSLFPEELAAGNLSLKISSVRLEDNGKYQCCLISESIERNCSIFVTDDNLTTQNYICSYFFDAKKLTGNGLCCK
uniref:CD276 antigen-like n=1 Tax=Xiphophorus maculatus TaxID=8083 RepID=A0A3B5QGJ8_XIPMA